MGVVYKTLDSTNGSTVALKSLPLGISQAVGGRRLGIIGALANPWSHLPRYQG
jgi:hypothetical protein